MRNLYKGTLNDPSGRDPDVTTELDLQMQQDWERMTGEVLPDSTKAAIYARILDKAAIRRCQLPQEYYFAGIVLSGLLVASYIVYILVFAPSTTTTYDQEGLLILTDGTEVALDAFSKLTVGPWSDDSHREVWLDGNASFSVEPAPERSKPKFIVHIKDLRVEVLGTKFQVNSSNGRVKIALESGKVVLKKDGSGHMEMKPGDCFEYNPSTGIFSNVSPIPQLIQRKDRNSNEADPHLLEFEDMPVYEVIDKINSRRDSQLIISNVALLQKRFSGEADLRHMGKFYRIMEEVFSTRIVAGDSNKFIQITMSTNEVY